MDTTPLNDPAPGKHHTEVERSFPRDLIVTRSFNAPVRVVFEAWTRPELLQRWWAPKSFGLSFIACETDVRMGGTYRFVFAHPAAEQPMVFFGRYTDVVPHTRLVWTNDEDSDATVTTVTFAEQDGATRVVMHDLCPSPDALDAAITSGSTAGFTEAFDQLDDLLATTRPALDGF